jgi:hypothetical protein
MGFRFQVPSLKSHLSAAVLFGMKRLVASKTEQELETRNFESEPET